MNNKDRMILEVLLMGVAEALDGRPGKVDLMENEQNGVKVLFVPIVDGKEVVFTDENSTTLLEETFEDDSKEGIAQ